MSNIGNPNLVGQAFELLEQLDEAVEELAKQGDMLAQAEYVYYRQKRDTALRLEEEGKTGTMIGHTLKGEPEVAILMREYRIAESRYRACMERINSLKKQITLHDNQIGREWGRSE